MVFKKKIKANYKDIGYELTNSLSNEDAGINKKLKNYQIIKIDEINYIHKSKYFINKVSIERIEEVDNDFYIEFTEQVKKPFTTKYHIVRINENESLLKSEISIYNLLLVTFTGERLFSYLLIIFFSMLISLKLLAFILIILLLIFFFSILSTQEMLISIKKYFENE